MKTFLLALLLSLPAMTQVSPQIQGAGAPTNPCFNGGQDYVDTTNKVVYHCSVAGSNWVLWNPGSGGSVTVAPPAALGTQNLVFPGNSQSATYAYQGIPVNPNSETTCSGITLTYNNRGSYIECSGTTTATVTLPLASGNTASSFPFVIFNNNTGNMTINATGPNTVNGGASELLFPSYMAFVYQDTGSPINWRLRKFPTFSAAGNIVNATGQTGSISTATLCDVTVGQCGTSGYYTVLFSVGQGGTACGTPGTGGVSVQLTWTDPAGTTHSAITIPVIDSSSTSAISPKFTFQTTNAAAFATGSLNIFTNGSIIQYATTYTACSVGTGTYTLRAIVTRQY